MGPLTITWLDLGAWCQQIDERLEPWEARLIVRLSVMRANIEGEEAQKRSRQKRK